MKGSNRQSEIELVSVPGTVWFEDLKDLDPQTSKFWNLHEIKTSIPENF